MERTGKSKTKTYKVWENMKDRCSNSNSPQFKDYGGRGIQVCDRWRKSFAAFLEDMGEAPKGLTLERLNNDGNYEPENCIWATWKQQANNKRSNQRIVHNGESHTVTEWSEILGTSKYKLYKRIERNPFADGAQLFKEGPVNDPLKTLFDFIVV